MLFVLFASEICFVDIYRFESLIDMVMVELCKSSKLFYRGCRIRNGQNVIVMGI